MFFAGIQQDITCSLSAYARYRMIGTSYPLVGVSRGTEVSEAAAIILLPEHEDRIELGGSWNPTANFMFNASLWVQNTYNHSDGFVNFDEDNYPVVLSAFYAPDHRWAFSGGYATLNWIDQDITLSSDVPFTSEWNYAGRSDVFNLGASYAWTCDLTLTGGVEYVTSRNVVTNTPAPAGAVTPFDLGQYGAVRVNTTRFTAGGDLRLTQNINCYGRYSFYDFDNAGWGYQSGTANMVLAGLSGVY